MYLAKVTSVKVILSINQELIVQCNQNNLFFKGKRSFID